jgi:hypothetical protein
MEHVAAIGQGVLGLVAFTARGLLCLLRVRRAGAAAWPLPMLLGGAFVVSSLLVAAFDGLCRAWLTEHLGLVVHRFQPDLIVVDNVRDIPRDCDLLRAKGMAVPGCDVAVHDPEAQYVIFRAASQRPARSTP